MAVSALQRPDFRTISDFRKRHLEALAGLFGQVLALCREAGLAEIEAWLRAAEAVDATEDAEQARSDAVTRCRPG